MYMRDGLWVPRSRQIIIFSFFLRLNVRDAPTRLSQMLSALFAFEGIDELRLTELSWVRCVALVLYFR